MMQAASAEGLGGAEAAGEAEADVEACFLRLLEQGLAWAAGELRLGCLGRAAAFLLRLAGLLEPSVLSVSLPWGLMLLHRGTSSAGLVVTPAATAASGCWFEQKWCSKRHRGKQPGRHPPARAGQELCRWMGICMPSRPLVLSLLALTRKGGPTLVPTRARLRRSSSAVTILRTGQPGVRLQACRASN